MKKIIINICSVILAAGMAFLPSGASAQTHYKPHISVGGHAGMTMSRMSFSPSVPQSWNEGLVIGVSARYTEEKIFGLIGELNMSQRGWKESFEDNPGLEYKRTLTYLELPLLTHIYFGPKRVKFFFNAGPQFSLMLSDKITANFDYNNPSEAGIDATRRVNQMSNEIKNKFDYGIVAGFGMEFWMRPRHSFTLEGRFYYGLGNIFPASKSDEFSASRNMTLEVTLGYNFRLK